jgi:AcrR family transcriptional regulator
MSKKELILVATLKTVGIKGYKGLTMAAVAKAADIGKSTLYEYFNSKEELLMEATVFFAKEFIERIYENAWTAGTSYESILKASIKQMIQVLGSEFKDHDSFFNSMAQMDYCEETKAAYTVAMKPVGEKAMSYTKKLIALGQEEKILRLGIDDVDIFITQRIIVGLTAILLRNDGNEVSIAALDEVQIVDHIYKYITKALS